MTLRSWLFIVAFAMICVGIGVTILTAGFLLFWSPNSDEGQMEIVLPSGGTYRAASQDDDLEDSPQRESAVVVVVRCRPDASGHIHSMALRTPQGSRTIPAATWRPELTAELRKARVGLDANASIKIEADKRLKWVAVVEIMDAAKEAGFTNVGFGPPPDE